MLRSALAGLSVAFLALSFATAYAASPAKPPMPPPQAASPQPAPPQPTQVKPSFDCTATKSKALLIVCGDDDLTRLDLQEDQLLRRARAKAVTPDAVNADQDLWISQRNACSNATCLSRAYRRRIQDLHAWAN